MITCGYWCDECRAKYVRYLCEKGMPCHHDKSQAIYVAAQAFGRHSEHIYIGETELVLAKRQDRDAVYTSAGAYLFWGSEVTLQNPIQYPEPIAVGMWLASKPDAFIRAFCARWESSTHVPDSVAFKAHPEAIRARALVRREA